MLYTEDFTMRHYVGFSQIGSQMCFMRNLASLYRGNNLAVVKTDIISHKEFKYLVFVSVF